MHEKVFVRYLNHSVFMAQNSWEIMMSVKKGTALIAKWCIIALLVSPVIISPDHVGTAAGQKDDPSIGPKEVTIYPVTPGPEEYVTIKILVIFPSGGYNIDKSYVVNGHSIEISLEWWEGGGVFPDMPAPWSTEIHLGKLEHGEYEIRITSTYNAHGVILYHDHAESFYVADRYADKQGVHGHERIQDAIDNSSEGDIIRVFSGSYHEDLNISTSISIVGNGTDATIVRSRELILNASDIGLKDISIIIEPGDDDKGEDDGSGDGLWETIRPDGDVRHGKQLLLLISTLVLLFVLLGLVVRIDDTRMI